MNKKYILLTISSILLVGLVAIIINRNSKEYIMQDRVMLALTLDGEKIDSYPNGTNYHVEVNCKNGKGKWLVDEWKLAVEEVTGNVLCNIDFASNPTLLKTEVEEKATTIANGYRYSGKRPNNYVWFNNEMWRIIGSIPVCLSASCGTNTTNLVKIIRNQSIGGLIYHATESSYNGSWGGNTLYTLLNSYYLGKQDATDTSYCYGYGYSARTNCNFSSIGIEVNGYYGNMLKNVYWNSGKSDMSQTAGNYYSYEITTRTASGYVGLMNASDYGYAADSSYHNTSTMYYNTADITGSNWMYQSEEWTMTQYNYQGSLFGIQRGGNVFYGYMQTAISTRPVVYLDSSVYIISGDGTEANPYQIGM